METCSQDCHMYVFKSSSAADFNKKVNVRSSILNVSMIIFFKLINAMQITTNLGIVQRQNIIYIQEAGLKGLV